MEDKDLYVIAVMRYKDENPGVDKEDLFPSSWDSNDDYRLKVNIIAEASETGNIRLDNSPVSFQAVPGNSQYHAARTPPPDKG